MRSSSRRLGEAAGDREDPALPRRTYFSCRRPELERLAEDEKLNLDHPAGNHLSGVQARDALKKLLPSGSKLRSTRGAPRSAEGWKERQWEEWGPYLVAILHVEGAPAGTLAEFKAWEAMEILRAKAKRDRRLRLRRTVEDLYRIFCDRLRPRLNWWKTEKEDCREAVLLLHYKSGLATIGLAGKPTERAIRNALKLSKSSRRRQAQLREALASGKTVTAYNTKGKPIRTRIKLGAPQQTEDLIARGRKIIGITDF